MRCNQWNKRVRNRCFRTALLGVAMVLLASSASADTYIVNTVGDEADLSPGDGVCMTALGTCSLRAALEEASTTTDPDTIVFEIPGEGGKVIEPTRALPPTVAVVIDGLSQGGDNYRGTPLIEIDGRSAGQYASGLQLYLDSVVFGIAIHGFGMHSVLLGESQMVASYVGLKSNGELGQETRDSAVVLGAGSALGCPTVQSNSICESPTVVVNNRRDAVELTGGDSTIDNTYIGVGPDGQSVLGNGGAGVRVPSILSGVIRDVLLGGAYPNIIAGSGGSAVAMVNAGPGSPSRIQVRQTPMYDNDGGAIAMGPPDSGFPLNDMGDTDGGANEQLNTPYLKSLVLNESAGVWELGGISGARYIDVYLASSAPGDAARERGAKEFLASIDLDSAANRATGTESYNVPGVGQDEARLFDIDVPVRVDGQVLIAIARDAQGNTSILSDAIKGPDLSLDSDGDGLPDALEIAWGLDPHNPDTDGDSLSDGEEWGPGLLPRDTDGDGIIDALDDDDDGDGIPTLYEIQAVGSLVDLDGDGLPAWRDTDSDGDGIPDAVEYALTDHNFDIHSGEQPAWNNVDSDGDGLCDTPLVDSPDCVGGEDVNADGVVDPGETDPYNPDTDGDGICDGPKRAGECTDVNDNCPLVPNPDQTDSVGDGIGDACRCDGENCPAGLTQCWADMDGDGFTGTPVLFDHDVDCEEQFYAGRALSGEYQGDCDDQNPRVHPNAIEICDGIDNNCNGLVDTEDPQVATLDPGQTGALDQTVYEDKDNDGCGMEGTDRYACSLDDPGISTNTLDQDDTDGVCCGNDILEEGEACDGENIGDARCPAGTYGRPICQNDPMFDAGDGTCTIAPNVGCISYKNCYADLDGDGFTGTVRTVPSDRDCSTYFTEGRPWTENDEGDCNDNPLDPCAVHTYPGAVERCDGCQNDCDRDVNRPDGADEPWFADACTFDGELPMCAIAGLVCGIDYSGESPEFGPTCGIVASESASFYFEDADGDGCGNPAVSMIVCAGDEPPEGWVDNAYDLDDTDGVCCGNNVVEEGEDCDGDTTTCADLGFASHATVACNSRCAWDISTCDNALCGNGVVDVTVGETCDPEAENAPVNCRDNCTFCGDGVVQELSGETCELGEPGCRENSCTFCGDGIVQTDEGEECEPREHEDGLCPYGETECTYCNDACEISKGETSYCGDGIVDEAEGEECDGEPNCDEDCQWRAATPENADDGCGCSSESTNPWSWMLACVVGGLLLHLRRRRIAY